MSLKIERTVNLIDAATPVELSVRLTLSLLGVLELVSYPGCWAVIVGGNVNVYAYADGPQAKPRAAWQSSLVLGIENFGDHPSFQAELAEQGRKSKEGFAIDLEEMNRPDGSRPLTGPDYPPAAPLPKRLPGEFHTPVTAEPGEMEGFDKPKGNASFRAVITMPLETQPEEVEARKRVMLAPKAVGSAKTPTHLLARPAEAPVQTLWTPRGRPTPHRVMKSRVSARKRPSRAFLGLRTLGTAMLVGFAALAGTD